MYTAATVPRLHSVHFNRTWEPVLHRMKDDERRGFEDLLRFYSPFGVIRKVTTYFAAGGTMPTYAAHGEYYDFDHVLRYMTGLSGLDTGVARTIFGGGKGHNLFRVFASTMGELVERVLGSLEYMERAAQCLRGTPRQLRQQGYRCLGPDEVFTFAPQQYGPASMIFDPYTDDALIHWIEGKRLFSGESVWVPAQLVLLYYQFQRDETVIGFSTTGGLATHVNEREALYHGITELFERDAMSLSWYARVPPAIIEIDRPVRDSALRHLLEVSSGQPGRMTFYLHTLDAPELPVLTVVEIDEWLNRYAYYSGGGVDLDIESAMLSGINEFGQAERNMRLALIAPDWGFARAIGHMFDVRPDVDTRALNIFFKIVPYYGYKQNIGKMDWYLHTPRRVKLSELPTLEDQSLDARWERLTRLLRRLRLDPIIFDFTPRQLRHAKLMKAFMPELVSPFPPSSPLLGHPRYYELPRQLGVTDRRLTYDDLNQDPLPYP